MPEKIPVQDQATIEWRQGGVPVAVIDDTEQNLYTISRYLRRAGFEVWEGRTGADALRFAEKKPGLMVLDVKLPDILGYEVCRRIKSNPATASIPVLHTSATYMETQDKVAGLEGGADAYLTAPIKPEELIATVRALLRIRDAEKRAETVATQWQTTFDAIANGVCLIDRDAKLERCNVALAGTLGRNPDELVGVPFSDVAALAGVDTLPYTRMLTSQRREMVETQARGRWWRITFDPVFQEGAVAGAVCIMADISDRRRSEEMLRMQYEVTRELVESVTIKEAAPRILRNMCEALGWSFGALWSVKPETAQLVCVDLWHASSANVPEFEVATRGGRTSRGGNFPAHSWAEQQPIWIPDLSAEVPFPFPRAAIAGREGFRSALAVPIRFGGGIIGVFEFFANEIRQPDTQLLEVLEGIGSQIGLFMERRRSEEALAVAQEDLRRHADELEEKVAERTAKLQESNKALEGFCYTIAHDLRAPLRAMGGITAALLDDYGPQLDEIGKDYASRVVAAAQRLDRLLQDLLAYGRISHTPISMQWIDLQLAIDEAAAQYSDDIRRGGAQIVTQQPLPQIWANDTLLGQILANLIGNALKFHKPDTVPVINITAEDGPDSVHVRVCDNGVGIEPKYTDRIFNVFERLTSSTSVPGTGIGLAIVKRAAERMNGRIGVESTPGEGSCFWFELPKCDAGGSAAL